MPLQISEAKPLTQTDEKLDPILDEVLRVLRLNAGETAFHQAVCEVLESLRGVVAKHPE